VVFTSLVFFFCERNLYLINKIVTSPYASLTFYVDPWHIKSFFFIKVRPAQFSYDRAKCNVIRFGSFINYVTNLALELLIKDYRIYRRGKRSKFKKVDDGSFVNGPSYLDFS